MKLEVGKRYKLRNGVIARCICVDRASPPPRNHTCLLLYTWKAGEDDCISTCSIDGTVYKNNSSDFDVISEYREPRVLYAMYDHFGALILCAKSEEERNKVLSNRKGWTSVTFVEKLD